MRFILCSILIFSGLTAFGQYSGWVATDRPCATMNPRSIGKKVVQVQTGYAHSVVEETNAKAISNIGETRIRYGILEQLDFNIGAAYTGGNKNGDSEFGLVNYQFNLRYLIYKGKGALPAVGLEVGASQGRIDVFREFENFEARAVLSLSSAVTEKLSITANAILPDPNTMEFTLNAAYAVNERFGVLAEYYPRFLRRSTVENTLAFDLTYINAGAYYNVSRNFQLDIAGFWLSDSGQEYAERGNLSGFQFQLGLTYRTDWR